MTNYFPRFPLARGKPSWSLRERFQHAYIADFWIPKWKTVIEVNGPYHQSKDAQAYDAFRTSVMNSIGIKVTRFTNRDVIKSLPSVIEAIRDCEP